MSSTLGIAVSRYPRATARLERSPARAILLVVVICLVRIVLPLAAAIKNPHLRQNEGHAPSTFRRRSHAIAQAGLLTRGSSEKTAPSREDHSQWLLAGSYPLTVAGPCWILTSFPVQTALSCANVTVFDSTVFPFSPSLPMFRTRDSKRFRPSQEKSGATPSGQKRQIAQSPRVPPVRNAKMLNPRQTGAGAYGRMGYETA